MPTKGYRPLASDFPFVTTYNYAENSPIAFIDLWGLQKAPPPMLRGGLNASVKGGMTGFQVKFLGARAGTTVSTAEHDMVGVSFGGDSQEGVEFSPTFFNTTTEKTGISGGEIFGGELSQTDDHETDVTTQKAVISLGFFNIINEKVMDSDGNTQRNTFVGIEFGVSNGIVIGFDLSANIEVNLSTTYVPADYKKPEEELGVSKQDNTRVELMVVPVNGEELKIDK